MNPLSVEFLNRFDIRQENDGSAIILYIDPQTSEFSTEFLHAVKHKQENLEEQVRQLVKEKLPGVKATAVKVMIGSLIVTTIPLFTNKTASAHTTDFNMSYIYFGNTSTYVSYIDKTQGNLKVIAPSFFDINPDGSLKVNASLTHSFVEDMHKKGVKVVPFVSNHWDRNSGRAALQNREKLAQDIAKAVATYNLDGVNVDIENVTEVDKDNYTDFVKLLSEKVPSEKEVSVAVAANPNGWTKGWHGSYDYNQLAKHADYLMIMAYDESYPGGPEGPVASLPWVERSINFAINQGVARDKIVLGIPFFGRYWEEGKSIGGDGIPNSRVQEMITKYESTVTFDEKTQSPKATITIKKGDPPFVVSGKTLGPGTYHIWFENEQSIKAKVDLVHKYEIKGTGSWALGQEDPAIWENYGVWLKGHGAETAEKPKENKIEPEQVQEETKEPVSEIVRGPRGEIGHVQVKKAINLWKRDANGKLQFVRVLNPGESYRVYGIDSKYGGQFDVGGSHFVTNMPEHVTFDSLTPSNNTETKDIEPVLKGPRGEIGHIRILKPINLWKRDSTGRITYARVLKPGEVYRVYNRDNLHGGQFDVGGNHYVTNMSGYVTFDPYKK